MEILERPRVKTRLEANTQQSIQSQFEKESSTLKGEFIHRLNTQDERATAKDSAESNQDYHHLD